ncbi:DUF3035 domain-containing protein [Pacificibacter marinus]|uniref:DUF3035 domain-containing protein n=1 Tax=Pacificibacter marinus TaxID=658057 RepID=UPI001C078FB7|nr:DUF3035 domain-containing protein [Pacificibacter marinus]MBU2866549.1 DUF3035 domain-containing protein [Pacificibacter marinus]
MLHAKSIRMVMCSVILIAATACAPKSTITPAAVGASPDEFSITPVKPLESPKDFAALPAPTLGGVNLTDATPKADAIVALGGRTSTATGVDGGIVTYASRYGVDQSIRSDLAASDARFRKLKTAAPSFPWVQNKYERAYRRLALDPWAELERLRALGVLVPSAPPKS